MFLARHGPSNKLVSLKLTDLTLSTDYEFIDELIVQELIDNCPKQYLDATCKYYAPLQNFCP